MTAPASRQPRAQGEARIGAVLARGRSRLGTLWQQGSAKILIPEARDSALEAVLLNTAGGITGGDRIGWAGEAQRGARLVLTTQAAERGYRAQPGETGRVETRLVIAPGARIDWLPQETILYDGSALHRRLHVEMAGDATLLAVEPVILGRAAMGETLRSVRFRDDWRVWRDGALIHADALRIEGDAAALTAPAAALGGNGAFATLLYVAPDAMDRVEEARAARAPHGAASARDGFLIMRAVADTGHALRGTVIATLARFLGRALPRVWSR